MAGARDAKMAQSLTADVKELKIKGNKDMASASNSRSSSATADEQSQIAGASNTPHSKMRRQKSESPADYLNASHSAVVKPGEVETIGGDITVTVEPGKAPKISRKASQKIIAQPPTLFSHLPAATDEATSSFDILTDCHYASRSLGSTEQALECDCSEEWDSISKSNHACGEDSDCINRATKMECPGDCGCGATCQNQRFQQKDYANVSVIKTEKKGYGLRANTDLKPNEFIFEYIGEVISEPSFRRRMHQYDQEGIKHFYFMSLTKSEFVDATKKGNLGRFCNHSCNPNCFVDKWVVGDKLRMGIFAERHIQAGEELVFNYNVDRYGADPQPCYCGEPNCSGFIGGKTQSGDDNATQLAVGVQLALGLTVAHEDDELWDQPRKPKRKKKVSEDDEAYIDSVELEPLTIAACIPLMAELYKNQEKWIIVKCLERIQKSDDERIQLRVAALHGYIILNRILKQWIDDVNVVLQVFDVIHKIPSTTKNKIQDAKIEETVLKLKDNEDERVQKQATELLDQWNKLEVAYRIPRVKRDKLAPPEKRPDRRERDRSRSRSRSRSKSVEAPKAPSGPRSNIPQRGGFRHGPRPPFRPRPSVGPLPPGWFEAIAQNGSTYFYNATGATTWQRPTQPALAGAPPPPPPPKNVSNAEHLQVLIDSIINRKPEPRKAEPTTPQGPAPSVTKNEKWRQWPVEKQKKLYENTLFPIVNQVMKEFRSKLDKDEIKRFGKEIAKKLVDSDFKHNRVADPSTIDPKMKKKITQYITQFFEKAVAKKKDHEKRKAEKMSRLGDTSTPAGSPPPTIGTPLNGQDDGVVELSENEIEDDNESRPSDTPGAMKRRYDGEEATVGAEGEDSMSKKPRTDYMPAPPPPPPPPAEGMEGIQMAQPGRTPSEDPIEDASGPAEKEEGPGFTIKGIAGASSRAGRSPTQTATPPTTGSPDSSDRDKKKSEYAGMNPERMRLMEG